MAISKSHPTWVFSPYWQDWAMHTRGEKLTAIPDPNYPHAFPFVCDYECPDCGSRLVFVREITGMSCALLYTCPGGHGYWFVWH